jgi:hypothetical protein
MSAMGCNEFVGQLDSWMEGERHPAARAHAQQCANCRSFAAELDGIRITAPTLSVADMEPSSRVWAALRAQLSEEGLIREGMIYRGLILDHIPAEQSGHTTWLRGLFLTVPRPAVAGAYLAFLIALAFGLSGPFAPRMAQTPRFPLSAQLDNAEQTTVSSFGSSKSVVAVSLHENLAIVDHYIALCEKSVREEPENDVAREYLDQAYQQKADLLAVMTERGDSIQ